MTLQNDIKKVKKAALVLATVSSDTKKKALQNIIHALHTNRLALLTANKKDLAQAKRNNLSQPLIQRLTLSDQKFQELLKGLASLMAAKDPVGKILSEVELDHDLILQQITCPIGVIGVIFEARPDAFVQIVSLCLTSGNAVIVKGGTEAAHSNKALFQLFTQATKNILPQDWLYLVETREDVNKLLSLDEDIDMIIPRGSDAFVKYIQDHTKIPVLGHSEGICHLYVDEEANQDMAIKIILDSKCQYPAACNAVETILLHKKLQKTFLPLLKKVLQKHGVMVKEGAKGKEYNDLMVSLNLVNSIQEAITHINTYGSGHTDGIITDNKQKAEQFCQGVDSASVLWNCSTRFADGYRYGKGAEVGISTNKIHARGPVGVEGLLIYKYILSGKGHLVRDYAEGKKQFIHKVLR